MKNSVNKKPDICWSSLLPKAIRFYRRLTTQSHNQNAKSKTKATLNEWRFAKKGQIYPVKGRKERKEEKRFLWKRWIYITMRWRRGQLRALTKNPILGILLSLTHTLTLILLEIQNINGVHKRKKTSENAREAKGRQMYWKLFAKSTE